MNRPPASIADKPLQRTIRSCEGQLLCPRDDRRRGQTSRSSTKIALTSPMTAHGPTDGLCVFVIVKTTIGKTAPATRNASASWSKRTSIARIYHSISMKEPDAHAAADPKLPPRARGKRIYPATKKPPLQSMNHMNAASARMS